MVVCRLFLVYAVVLWFGFVADPTNATLMDFKGYRIYELSAYNRKGGDLMLNKFNHLMKGLHPLQARFVAKSHQNMLTVLMAPGSSADRELVDAVRGKVNMRVLNNDVAVSVAISYGDPPYAGVTRPFEDKFKHYLRYEEIVSYLIYLNETYNDVVNVDGFHRTTEGRQMYTVFISKNMYDNGEPKPIILIDATLRGRDWISTSMALYVIEQLVEHTDQYEYELKYFDWMILPVVNPDGYEYTHEVDRFWQKTRRPNLHNKSELCVGTDLNFNFDCFWVHAGASLDACSTRYAGLKPLSEPETMAVRTMLDYLKKSCRMYVTLNSYGGSILYPYHHTTSLPDNWEKLHEIALAGAAAIQRHSGIVYEVGSYARIVEPVSGTSDSYAFNIAKIPVTFTMRLPSGPDGMDPRPNQIADVVEAAWMGVRAMTGKLYQLGDVRNAANQLPIKFPIVVVCYLLAGAFVMFGVRRHCVGLVLGVCFMCNALSIEG